MRDADRTQISYQAKDHLGSSGTTDANRTQTSRLPNKLAMDTSVDKPFTNRHCCSQIMVI